jgi:hypothetical protein
VPATNKLHVEREALRELFHSRIVAILFNLQERFYHGQLCIGYVAEAESRQLLGWSPCLVLPLVQSTDVMLTVVSPTRLPLHRLTSLKSIALNRLHIGRSGSV